MFFALFTDSGCTDAGTFEFTVDVAHAATNASANGTNASAYGPDSGPVLQFKN
jgi:hypothetical protein